MTRLNSAEASSENNFNDFDTNGAVTQYYETLFYFRSDFETAKLSFGGRVRLFHGIVLQP